MDFKEKLKEAKRINVGGKEVILLHRVEDFEENKSALLDALRETGDEVVAVIFLKDKETHGLLFKNGDYRESRNFSDLLTAVRMSLSVTQGLPLFAFEIIVPARDRIFDFIRFKKALAAADADVREYTYVNAPTSLSVRKERVYGSLVLECLSTLVRQNGYSNEYVITVRPHPFWSTTYEELVDYTRELRKQLEKRDYTTRGFYVREEKFKR